MAPTPSEGIIVGIVVSMLVTLLVYRFTESKWSWVPRAILGIVAGAVVSLSPPGAWFPW
ncbi:MAG: hypothetical protein OEZ21_04380 [Candidatus Bathyarchaeota archaeon]|nr:hypothetical protein [Candidatus Bathyarchaeota archaeon]MDH5746180.1 hypothetical protein [Candidatus Bathyarchaeota archaeon]